MIEHTVTNSKDEVSREIGFHHYLARLPQNPSLIIMDFADNLIDDLKNQIRLDTDLFDIVKKYHFRNLEYPANGDGDKAPETTQDDILWVDSIMAQLTDTRLFDPNIFS